jgi:hypothetical protein
VVFVASTNVLQGFGFGSDVALIQHFTCSNGRVFLNCELV